jgi:hypothetical protein
MPTPAAFGYLAIALAMPENWQWYNRQSLDSRPVLTRSPLGRGQGEYDRPCSQGSLTLTVSHRKQPQCTVYWFRCGDKHHDSRTLLSLSRIQHTKSFIFAFRRIFVVLLLSYFLNRADFSTLR